MSAYVWTYPVSRFEMRLLPNVRTFVGPYTQTVQTLDLLGERWTISMDIPPTTDLIASAGREAFFDRLKGSSNTITIGHQKLLVPQGTLRGTIPATWKNSSAATATWKNASAVTATWMAGNPVISGDIAQLANTGAIRTVPGNTLLAGDMLGFGGQLVRIMLNTVADGTGLMPIEFQPRARQAIPNGTQVFWNAPTASFILKPGTVNVPTSWTPGMVDAATIELIETY